MLTRAPRNRLAQSDTWLLELFLALYTLVWGVGYVNPLTDSFAANPRGTALLAQFPGGELGLGLFVTGLGTGALWVTLNCPRRTRRMLLSVCGGFWVWVLVSVGLASDWSAGGLPHFGLVVLAHWFCWARLRWREDG